MQIDRDALFSRIREIIHSYTGHYISEQDYDKLIGDDLGIIGGDSVDFQDEIEADFEVNLEPLVAKNVRYAPRDLFRRLFGLPAREYSDVTVKELLDHIASSTTRHPVT